MKINISELFRYRQYVDAPACYCFDRKDYKIRDISVYESESNTPFQRYIPLLRVDEKTIQDNYILSLNDKYILREYQNTNLCFNAFVDGKALWEDWWRYYTTTIFELEKAWCEENNIAYVYDL